MKIQELLEGQLQQGRYELGQRPTLSDKALAHFFNNVRPALSRIFDIPEAHFKIHGDHLGLGWRPGFTRSRLFWYEKSIMHVTLRKKNLDVDLLAQMLPKVLKNELSKQLVDVEVSEVTYTPATRDKSAFLELNFSSNYPQKWIGYENTRIT
ncbi:MAG: hypothetical protein DDT31_00685 [Syntrophomonadaceae bacterium]|nr:hypothetical protein [Bacillota bacterium]